MLNAIFTIGHSTHTQEYFIGLLTRHGITALCDVRSKPYSRVNPQFNREELKESLAACGITYVFLGKELGARSEDPACYENGKVQYDRLSHTVLFRQGLERIQKGMQEYRIAIRSRLLPLLVPLHFSCLAFRSTMGNQYTSLFKNTRNSWDRNPSRLTSALSLSHRYQAGMRSTGSEYFQRKGLAVF
ncbi:MAG: DUF488 domain-containing protein [Bryobacteraceae bacterium]